MGFSFKAMWQYKCPKCRTDNTSLFKKPFRFNNPLDMNKYCHVCGQDFEPEPGYYYGAMFISYIVSSFILLPIALILVFYFKWSDEAMMAFIVALGVLMFFRILRVSRSLYIHALVRYDPMARAIKKQKIETVDSMNN